jgi:succinyl-CoA synthetase alpha subunit
MRDLSRLFRPRSIAVVGGGAWGRAIVTQCRKMGFDGPIWPVNPKGGDLAGIPCVARIEDLPEAPDASFVGINRHATVEAVAALSAMGAGGAVCFAAGFAEAVAEDDSGADLQAALLAAAGAMPILGPNCYGFINALDGALLWPDQHGLTPVARGAAIATQSSNILINLTMQARGLPIAYAVTAGNQAQTGLAEIGLGLLDDPRVTVLGLHVEGFSDLRAWERLSARAAALGKPVVVLKVGRSAQAQAATVSHTASLAGGDAGAQALIERLGFARVAGLSEFLEVLKLLHVTGPLPSNRIASISCSGGEASLAADTAVGRGVEFPALNDRQKADLRAALGPMVALANPLDYHTYIWRDARAMTRAWAAMVDPSLALTMTIVDFPRADRCDAADWDCTIEAALGAFRGNIQQVPPQYSAVKVEGERAYDIARSGEVMDLAARDLFVERLDLLEVVDADTAILEMVCGKGGYVRSIARDLGAALGCLGHVAWLRREWSGPFWADQGLTLEQVDAMARTDALDAHVRPLEIGLADLPRAVVSDAGAVRLRNGNPGEVLTTEAAPGDTAWAVYQGQPLAVGTYMGGMLHPNRVFNLGDCAQGRCICDCFVRRVARLAWVQTQLRGSDDPRPRRHPHWPRASESRRS